MLATPLLVLGKYSTVTPSTLGSLLGRSEMQRRCNGKPTCHV